MDRTGQQPVILVGVSGSRASLAALHWAAQEAHRRDAALRVLEAWQSHPARVPYAAAVTGGHVRISKAMAAAHLAAEVSAVVGEPASIDVIAEVAEGAAERILTDASAAADLLVLGSGTQPLFASHTDPLVVDRPVGPVIRACLSHARCPVVVISPVLAAQQAVGLAARAGRLAPAVGT